MNAYFNGMRRYFDFSGRSSKSQYWLFSLGVFVLGLIAITLDGAVLGSTDPAVLTGLVSIAHWIPGIAVTVRRLHDADKSGWLTLLLLVPVVNLVCYIAFGCFDSTPGVNRFGPPVTAKGALPATAGHTAPDVDQGGVTVERLEKLAVLRASGAIDQSEFDRLKAAALKGGA